MSNLQHPGSTLTRFARALLATVLLATAFIAAPLAAPSAEAQATTSLEVWGISGGIVENPKQWKHTQSFDAATDLGTASAAALGFDDSAWTDVDLRWKTFPGPFVANHFRKDFTLDEIDVEMFQIVGMQVSMQYDDSAILYLNGTEVYRSIRGNLDPTYSLYPLSADIPFDVNIPYGGAEEHYVGIPNVNGTNTCEFSGPACGASPYGGPNPPAISKDLLRDGINTWAVTTWNQSGGGSGDSTLNHTFELLIDESAVPPNPIFINEVMASNRNAWGVYLDDDPELEYPDWFELNNISNDPVDLAGWTISDTSTSWVFPSVTVPANGYLVVAANDADRTDTTPLQTNFKFSSLGDTLKLTNPGGFVADEYAVLPQQFEDNSYGRPSDAGTPTYLSTFTPGEANGVAGDGYAPILRPFANRIYNAGEFVSHQVNAFDPDGDALAFSMAPLPSGLSMSSTGLIEGVLTSAGNVASNLTVTDADNDSASQLVQWLVLPAVTNPVPLVLNEYNAVAGERELLGGGPLGNGGDWFEFVVIEDNLDLRGYQIDLYDRKGTGDQLRLAASVSFGDDVRIGSAPAGTIVTISEDNPDDLSFNGVDDWHINFQITNVANGAFFGQAGIGQVFNSTRSGQTVVIKDSTGAIVTPLSGESEAWDTANGGVSGAEVMNLCVNPTPGMSLNPVTDYQDTGASSSFGQPNTCVYPDPNDPTVVVTFDQSLAALRATATFGAGSGDTNCDGKLNVADALITAQFSVGNHVDSGPCFFDGGGPGFDMYGDAADINNNGTVNVADAVIIANCVVGNDLTWCPQ